MFVIYYSKEAIQNLEKLDKITIERFYKKIDEIKENPFLFIQRLVSINLWKLRVGDYRVLLSVNKSENTILIVSICHRRNVYKNLK